MILKFNLLLPARPSVFLRKISVVVGFPSNGCVGGVFETGVDLTVEIFDWSGDGGDVLLKPFGPRGARRPLRTHEGVFDGSDLRLALRLHATLQSLKVRGDGGGGGGIAGGWRRGGGGEIGWKNKRYHRSSDPWQCSEKWKKIRINLVFRLSRIEKNLFQNMTLRATGCII